MNCLVKPVKFNVILSDIRVVAAFWLTFFHCWKFGGNDITVSAIFISEFALCCWIFESVVSVDLPQPRYTLNTEKHDFLTKYWMDFFPSRSLSCVAWHSFFPVLIHFSWVSFHDSFRWKVLNKLFCRNKKSL